MFPVTDNSQTIIDCLKSEAQKLKVTIAHRVKIADIQKVDDRFVLESSGAPLPEFDGVMLATGSASSGYKFATSLGHTITDRAPSLFTFEVNDPRIAGLQGLSFPSCALTLEVAGRTFRQNGPVLITHWGLSGPAVLKLSAWAARELASTEYQARLFCNWFDGATKQEVTQRLRAFASESAKKSISGNSPFDFTKRFWHQQVTLAGIDATTNYASFSGSSQEALVDELMGRPFQVAGKGEFKDEFVTCGGVELSEVDFRTMMSKKTPGLFFGGEVLDIDGITGGYNFQAAWTTGWIAAEGIATYLQE